jgi:hypothetical protein
MQLNYTELRLIFFYTEISEILLSKVTYVFGSGNIMQLNYMELRLILF